MSSDPSKREPTVVVGAGISGLTTAYALEQQGEPVCILEAEDRPGGVIRSERVGPFLFEFGPNSLLKKSSDVEWLINALNLSNEVQVAGDQADRRYIVRNDQLHAVPMDPASFISTNLLSWAGKGSLLLEPFRKPGGVTDDESLASFIQRRLGSEALNYLVDPMVAGIYAGSPERMSARASAEKFAGWEREYGGLLNGAMASKLELPNREESDNVDRELISFPDGMETIIQRLADNLSGAIRYRHEVERIVPMNDQGYRIQVQNKNREQSITIEADQVVITTPTFTAAEILDPLPRTVKDELQNLYYPPLAVVLFGYETYEGEHPLDGFGFLVPSVEERRILGSLWNGTIFPDRAPEDGAVFTTFLGGARQPEIARRNRDELVELVRDDLNDLIGLKQTPDVVRVKQWDRSIPQYERGHMQLMKQLDQLEDRHPGLFIHGNYRNGVSVPACIQKGITYADRVKEAN